MLTRGLFLLVIADDILYADASEICQRLSVTRRARTLDEGLRLLEAHGGWAGAVIESSMLGIAVQRGLLQVRNVSPALPCLLLTDDAARGSTLPQNPDAIGLELADSECGRARLESFTRRALVLELLPDPQVASRVDRLCADLNLTSREVQLLAYALGREPRPLVLKRLGITVNTLKSQVRALLRKCGGRSMTELADRVAHGEATKGTLLTC